MNINTLINRITALYATDSFDCAFSLADLQSIGTPALRRIYAAARARAIALDPELDAATFAELTTGENVTQLVPRRNHPAAMTRAALSVVDTLTARRSVQISEETIEWGGFLGGHTVNRHDNGAIVSILRSAA